MFSLSSSGVRGVRGKPLGSVSEYTCAGPAGERARTEVAGVRPDPSDATLTAVTRGRSVGGDCVGPQGPLLACAVPVAVTRYAAPLGNRSDSSQSIDTSRICRRSHAVGLRTI